jgi:menaquinone-specific isochorismate synthase
LLSGERTDLLRAEGPARWVLADRVGHALSSAAGALPETVAAPEERVMRVEAPVGSSARLAHPLRWLRAQRLTPKLYWSGREGGAAVAAVGAADSHEGEAWEDAPALWKRLAPLLASGEPGVRYYGGLRFDPGREPDAEWASFGAYRFVLPRFELVARGGETTLVCNLVLPRDGERRDEILEEIEHLTFPGDQGAETPEAPVTRADSPDPATWKRNVEKALAAFAEGRLGKVVLARRTVLEFDADVDATLVAERLEATTPGCFQYYIEPEMGSAFLGASPELLFRREGRLLRSEAVAGTRPRGSSAADDAGLREELLGSAKDLSEHAYVRTSIEEMLGALCDELEVEEGVSEMKLTSRRHLVSRVRGTLRASVTDADVLGALHPTPAVGGYPRVEALEELRSLEPFDRGWYAGPVGWIGAGGSEFAVGIRSGLVRGRTLALFSGAGIVAGSVPKDEWTEVEQKIGDFTRIFGFGPEHGAR